MNRVSFLATRSHLLAVDHRREQDDCHLRSEDDYHRNKQEMVNDTNQE